MGFRDSYNRVLEDIDTPGPEVAVSPFRPGTVTGEAVAIKALASLVAGRRAAQAAAEKRKSEEANRAYKDALTRQIEGKLAAPTPTYEVDINGTKVPLKPAQYAAHSRATTPKAPVRVPVSAALRPRVKDFSTYDPETNTVDKEEAGQVERGLIRTAVEDRFKRGQQGVESRFTRGLKFRENVHATAEAHRTERAHLDYLQKREKEIEANEKIYAGDAEKRGLQYATKWMQTMMDPNETPANKQYAARALGLPISRDESGKVQVDPKTKMTLYDITGIHQRVKDYAAKYRKWALSNIQAQNAPARLYLQQQRRTALGEEPAGGSAGADSVSDALNELARLYLSTPGSAATDEQPEIDPATVPEDELYPPDEEQ